MNKLPNKAYLWPIEVARYFSVSRSTVYNWINSGLLRAHKIGKLWRIPRAEVERIEREGLRPYAGDDP